MIHALVCDDYEPIANLVRIALRQLGFKVSIASDGIGALDLIHSIRPGLIISDVEMPGLSGIGVYKSLQLDTTGLADIPFILMSSSNYELEALDAGCKLFLAKPFPIEDLRCAVSTALPCYEGIPD
ncbi:MAG: response regulator [Chloroflexi bacterium]|nr:response regulator [Chloroflexota bacterium]MDA1220003.1 response regulator [Chloroflexota bacterium]